MKPRETSMHHQSHFGPTELWASCSLSEGTVVERAELGQRLSPDKGTEEKGGDVTLGLGQSWIFIQTGRKNP